MRASEMRIMSVMPALQDFRRQRHVADLRHSRITLRAAILEHHHAGLVDIERIVVDAGMQVLDRLEHHRAARMLHQVRARPPTV